MSDLTSGTVTFLYTDIEGSTRLWEKHPKHMSAALTQHDQIWRDAVAGNDGQIFRVTGDGFCASFSQVQSAVAAAVTAQRALSSADWGSIERLRVRAIIHTGAAEVRSGDYVGGSLNIAGRLLSVCHGGQTLLSPSTADLVRQQLPSETEILALGRQRFRDISDALEIYQLSIAGLDNDFPPLSSVDATPHNLPEPLSSFIGREQELDDVRQLLHENRLVTLVGPGGTGKTRLSLKAADELKELFIDGVWLIELASINDPALVDQAVAAVLRIQEQPGRPILQSISTYLRRKQLLLLLDNCEHLVDASAKTAAALLQSCPDVRILASSREGLGIAGESVYPLHPLALPEDKETSEAIAEYEAVRLFLTRAEQVRPDFKLNDANAPFVARICRRLDGIPLAIELAAARMKHLTPKQIAARLDQSFRLLTGGSRAALPRQQTLRALIDWSYELLSPAERLLFQRLAVFHGGWTLAAAEEVCAQGTDDSSCLDPFDILDLNGSLVEKSMIELDLQSAEPRYKLLETMRQYGLEKLKETGEALLIRDNHLTYYSTMALEAELPILRRQEQEAIERLDADHDNIVAALEWASSGSLEPFLNFVVALNPYWSSVSYAAEARYWLDQVLSDVDLSSPTSSESKQLDRIGQALFYQGLMAFLQGDNTSAATALEQSYNTSLQSGNLFFAAQSLGLRSPALMHIGRLDDALASAQEALQIARQLGDDQHVALLKSHLDAQQFSSSGAKGRAMSIEQAEDYALSKIAAVGD